ncbi:hypothetical protein LguiA_010382 [Lonicera macranthoides]
MFHGGPSNKERPATEVADKRAYEDSRPHLSSFLFPEPIKELLQDCWHKNPDTRPTFEEIIIRLERIQELCKKGNGTCNSCGIL